MTDFLSHSSSPSNTGRNAWSVRDALPATASGKIQKFALREMLRSDAAGSN